MPDFNMPPGVSVNDIPGNRPEDLAEEAWWDALFQHPDIPSSYLPEEWWDDEGITKLVNIARDLAYSAGYGAGLADAQVAEAERESESANPQPQEAAKMTDAEVERRIKAHADWLATKLREGGWLEVSVFESGNVPGGWTVECVTREGVTLNHEIVGGPWENDGTYDDGIDAWEAAHGSVADDNP